MKPADVLQTCPFALNTPAIFIKKSFGKKLLTRHGYKNEEEIQLIWWVSGI